MGQEIQEIELSMISVNPHQPRQFFCQKEIEELAQSIHSVGLIQPPVVRSLGSASGKYELISGERRFRAAQFAGLAKVPVIIWEEGKHISAEAALVENIQRVDLNSMEIAKALRQLIEEFGYQQEELAGRLGKKRSTIANYLRLLTLPQKIQDSVSSGEISMGHAKAILSVEGFEGQLFLHEKVVAGNLSVRQTELAAQNMEKAPRRRLFGGAPGDCHLEALKQRLQHKFGTKVAIHTKGSGGCISIDYYNLDDLDRVLELIFGIS